MNGERFPARAKRAARRPSAGVAPLRVALFALAACAPCVAVPSTVAAQEPPPCERGRISFVFIDNHSVFDTDEMREGTRFLWVYEVANTVHMDTDRDFIQDEILFEEGDCYDPEILAESERLLRRHGFIAQVDVYGLLQADGSWHVVVDTKDEWTTKLDVRFQVDQALEFRGADITEENLFGRGHLAGFFFRERDEQRDIGARLFTPRLLGTRLDAQIEGGRTRDGSFFEQELFYPFVGEVGRFAGREVFLRRDDLFPYAVGEPGLEGAPDATHLLLPFERELVEVTVAARIGRPGNLTVFGLGVSDETLDFPDFPGGLRVARSGDFDGSDATSDGVEDRIRPQTLHRSGTRVNLLFGQRNIRFVQRRGLDALRGVQDVEVGTDFGLTVGRSIGALTADEDEPTSLYTRLRAFGGFATHSFVGNVSLAAEAQNLLSGGEAGTGWRNELLELDGLFYWQSTERRHTVLAQVSGAGGWNTTLPFQLTLGGPQGVRGYSDRDFPGARRLVFTIEDRLYVPWPFPEVFDFGFTGFADAGRMWAGDVPFGQTTDWRAAIGAGLRVGFPAGTRGVGRIDVAWPLESGGGLRDVILRITFTDLIGLGAGLRDHQLQRSRLTKIGPDVFTPSGS